MYPFQQPQPPVPQTAYGAGYPQQPPPRQPTTEERLRAAVDRIRALKNENTQAYNPYSLQKVNAGILDVLEWILSGTVSSAHPNQVPGLPMNPVDQDKPRVEFYGGPQQPQPQPAGTPVVNGDVQFTYAPAGGGGNGQTVEYYGGPGQPQPQPQSPFQPPQLQAPFQPPQPQAPFHFQSQGPFQPPPPGAHVGNPVSNDPAATFAPGSTPPLSVEAGGRLPVASAIRPMSMPVAAPFAREERSMPAPGPLPPRPPETREELLAMLPIPTTPEPQR